MSRRYVIGILVAGFLASGSWALAQRPVAPGGDAKLNADVQRAVGIFMKVAAATADADVFRTEMSRDRVLPAAIKAYREFSGTDRLDLANSRVVGDAAIVVTTPLPEAPGKPGGPLVFRLVRTASGGDAGGEGWQITAVEQRTGEQARAETEAFIRRADGFPAAPAADAQAGDVDPLFNQLLRPGTRDAAARQLLTRWEGQKVENLSIYGVPPVRHVLLCPQPAGDPMALLFLSGRKTLPVGRAEGPCVLLDAKGQFQRGFWLEAGRDLLLDINGDGVIEHVEAVNVSFGKIPGEINVQVVRIMPVVLPLRASLMVAYNSSHEPKRMDPGPWAWEVRSVASGLYSIVLGPRDPATKVLTPVASYTWSDAKKEYVGPPGSKAEKFLRLSRADFGDARAFAE